MTVPFALDLACLMMSTETTDAESDRDPDVLLRAAGSGPDNPRSSLSGGDRPTGDVIDSAHQDGRDPWRDHGHGAAPLRLVAAPSAPAYVILSPSLVRMGVVARLVIAALLATGVWAATLAVIG